jgi:signal transduction histidine kinase/ActR/RegA family two-component response regulator
MVGDDAPLTLPARIFDVSQELRAHIEALAPSLGLEPRVVEALDPEVSSGVHLLLLEELRSPADAAPRVLSISSAFPDALVVVLVPAPRRAYQALLAGGAFDVVERDELAEHLLHTVTAARRVFRAEIEQRRLRADVAHGDRLEAMGMLVAAIGHEINNPCSAILANATTMREQLEAVLARSPPLQQRAVEAAAADWLEMLGDSIGATLRVRDIIRTLGMFSRKADDAPPAPLALNDEIHAVLRLVGKELVFQVSVELDLAAGLPAIRARPASIMQIVTNLVVNALQATESRSEGRVLRVRTSAEEHRVMLEIADNGVGMTPDVIAQIFDPFFTTKGPGKGTGLGLFVTRELVAECGGEIFVDSEPGVGTTFRVFFPPAAGLGERPRSTQPPPCGQQLRLLVIDDDQAVLRATTRLLGREFDCTSASTVFEANQLLATQRFDVVLADVLMPDGNGVDLFEASTARDPSLARCFVFTSGGVVSKDLRDRLVATGRPVLEKPADRHELRRVLRAVGTGLPLPPARTTSMIVRTVTPYPGTKRGA